VNSIHRYRLIPALAAFAMLIWAPARAATSDLIAVHVSGDIPPGYTQADLTAYVVQRFQEVGANWQVTAGDNGTVDQNHIDLLFKTLKIVWPSRSHKGFPSPGAQATYVSIEAKLYLQGAYQTTTLSEATAYGGVDDKNFANSVRYLGRTLFTYAKTGPP
jgi:hypothetical protein